MSPEEKINLVFNGNRLCGKMDHRPRGDDLMDVVVAREQKMNKKKRRHEEYLCCSLN